MKDEKGLKKKKKREKFLTLVLEITIISHSEKQSRILYSTVGNLYLNELI